MNARIFTSSLLAVAAWVGAGSAVRADHLDQKLMEETPKIVEMLRSKGYHNIGVMRFRVKVGNKAESFSTGTLNGSLANRLENALVIHAGADEKTALGVIHEASKNAMKHKVGNWYSDKTEREKLFGFNYPLAWGSKQVKPDVLLTGLVEVSPDYSKASITIEAFTAKNTELSRMGSRFNIDGDTPLLHDLGKSYAVASRNLPKMRTAANVRNVIFKEVKKRDEDMTPDKPTSDDGTMVGDVLFKLLSAGQPVTIKGGTENDKTMTVECPDQKNPVTFSITNKGTKKLGVDVRLNDISLVLRQKEPSEACRVWVLEPGKTYELKGYYDEGNDKNVSPFAILTGEAAKTAREQLGEKAGEIQINVFEEVTTPMPGGDEMMISRGIRGLKGKQNKEVRANLDSLQRSLMKGAAVRRVTQNVGGTKRELIVEDPDETKKLTEALKAVDFKKGSSAIASQTIKILPGATPPDDKDGDKGDKEDKGDKSDNKSGNKGDNKSGNKGDNKSGNKDNKSDNKSGNKPDNKSSDNKSNNKPDNK